MLLSGEKLRKYNKITIKYQLFCKGKPGDLKTRKGLVIL